MLYEACCSLCWNLVFNMQFTVGVPWVSAALCFAWQLHPCKGINHKNKHQSPMNSSACYNVQHFARLCGKTGSNKTRNVRAQWSMNREIQGSFLENCNQVTKHHSFWTVSPYFQVFLIEMQWVIVLLIKLLLQQEKHMCDLWWRFRLNNARMYKHTHAALMFFCSFLIRTQHFVSLPMTAHNKNDCCCDLFWMASCTHHATSVTVRQTVLQCILTRLRIALSPKDMTNLFNFITHGNPNPGSHWDAQEVWKTFHLMHKGKAVVPHVTPQGKEHSHQQCPPLDTSALQMTVKLGKF